MIKMIKSKLSVKVFLLTFALLVGCCFVTYWCIARFSPYIYFHDISEGEEIAIQLSQIMSECDPAEIEYFVAEESEMLKNFCDDEFVFHIFNGSGAELVLPQLSDQTGKRIEDYEGQDVSGRYTVSLVDGTEEYTLLIAKNEDKESQIIEALRKSIPIMSIIVFAIALVAAFFYTWYMTEPIKRISRLSKQMADMDFSGLCPVQRTDEIGVLSGSLNELSQKLSSALLELQGANEKLQADIDKERQLERQRVEFFSAASHELKTPITIIKGQLQGMLYQVGRYKDRDAYLAQSLEVTGTLEEMVQELLTISRLDTPGYICNKSDLDLGRLINDRLSAHEDLFMQRGLSVEKSVPPGIYISGDAQLLQKALDNLLGNAASYSPKGNCISVKLWKDAERVNLTVENTGIHIPEGAIPRLFEAFYRVDQSRNRQTGGTGLGLYIVKTILDLHRAEIEISNSAEGVIISIQF